MDDLEFRRRAYAEPDCQDKDFIAFKNSSLENSRFVDELKLLDDKLKQGLHIKAPEDLIENIKLQQTLASHQSSRKKMRLWSMAASVFLVLSVTFNYLTNTDNISNQVLSDNVMEHIYHELDHLYEKQNKSLAQVNQLLAEFGGNITQVSGQVNYLGSCDIAHTKGVHMVVQGEVGPITVMLLPGVPVDSQHEIKDKRFKGIIVPGKKGSIAIVGEKSESLQALKDELALQFHWI